MKRLTLFLTIIIFAATSIFGSPVFRVKKTVRQSDGTELVVTRTGVNHVLYYVTDDGMPVFPNDNGDYCYAEFDDDFNVVASTIVAHEEGKRTPIEQQWAVKYKEAFETAFNMHNQTRYGVGSHYYGSVSCMGDVKVAVVMAEFTDVSFKEENDIARFERHLNASNYKEENGGGSLRDYFIAQSDSLFRPQFDVVAKVKVSKTRREYGGNSGGNDRNDRGYICEAVDSAYAHGVDFSKYLNEKGELFVIVLFPGHGEQVSGTSECIWAQYFYSLSHTVGPHKLVAGLVMDELANYGAGEQFDGIGTLAHEFSHALGLPDFYNTTSANNIFGMDAWSIMDYGQFNKYSTTPVGYTCYEREFMGWLKVDTLKDEKQLVTLTPLHKIGEKNRAYRILNKADKTGNEYYMIENRQSSTWFSKTYGEGMLVLHVDYNASAWSSNTINNAYAHQRMTIIPADGVLTKISGIASTYKGDPFPGYTNNQEFGNTTTPCDTAYTGGHMNISMKNIHEISDNIVFYYQCDGQLAKPADISVSEQTESGFKVSYSAVENAEKYEVCVYSADTLVQSSTTTELSKTIEGLAANSTYIVAVIAQADSYLDSDPQAMEVTVISGKKGDVNEDGLINASDVVSIYNYIMIGDNSNIKRIRADVNEDKFVNAADVTSVYNIIINGKQ